MEPIVYKQFPYRLIKYVFIKRPTAKEANEKMTIDDIVFLKSLMESIFNEIDLQSHPDWIDLYIDRCAMVAKSRKRYKKRILDKETIRQNINYLKTRLFK